jgi:hypothetical protein
MTGVHHCAQLLVKMGASKSFCLDWLWTVILPISAFQVVRITGLSCRAGLKSCYWLFSGGGCFWKLHTILTPSLDLNLFLTNFGWKAAGFQIGPRTGEMGQKQCKFVHSSLFWLDIQLLLWRNTSGIVTSCWLTSRVLKMLILTSFACALLLWKSRFLEIFILWHKH